MEPTLMHPALYMPRDFRAGRESSWDRTGRNEDCWRLEAGEARTIADLEGPGIISHLWMTIHSDDALRLRKILFRAYWDGEREPSIDSPVGDFFGLGHARPFTYQCAAFSTSCNRDGDQAAGVAMNCWLPMPFRRGARLELLNEQDTPVRAVYFYVDYQKHRRLPGAALRFHARWRREQPCDGWTGPSGVEESGEWNRRMDGPDGANLSDEGNYLILAAEGRGHYIGVSLAVDNLCRGWWGEGDDMIFIDRDGARAWPPDMHGTGSEDYFCHAWGMQKTAHLYSGASWREKEDHNAEGKVCVYRFHLLDPVPFRRNIRVSIEHGHANSRSDDYSSVAYWYQDEPHRPFGPRVPVGSRLPL